MVKLKNRNYWAIRNHVVTGDSTIQGSKLEALYNLIQAQGEPIEAEGWMNGLNALKISDTEFVAIEHTPATPASFYPCRMRTILIEQT